MKKYRYTAVNLNKEKFDGTFIANDEKDLAAQLAKQNLFLVSCSVYTGKTPSAFFTTGTGQVNTAELTSFCRQFAIMINAGISIIECLELLKEQSYSSYFKNLLSIIYDDVKSGIMLSDALNKHQKVFPEFFRSMVCVGEVSGKLDGVLNALADYYERESALKRKTKSAFSYPIMLAIMTVGIVILMLTFVIPTFRTTLDAIDVEVEGLTKAVYVTSDFMVSNWLYVLAVISVIGIGLFIFNQTKAGKIFTDKLKIKVPFLKKVTVDLVSARFARSFSLMASSGTDIVDTLDAVSVVLGNNDVEERFKKAAEEVKHGSKLADAFEKYKLFPQIMIQMIAVGERTASLEEIMTRSCAYFDEQVEATLSSVTSKIQPIMLCIMGVVIAVLFMAVYSPLITIMSSLGA